MSNVHMDKELDKKLAKGKYIRDVAAEDQELWLLKNWKFEDRMASIALCSSWQILFFSIVISYFYDSGLNSAVVVLTFQELVIEQFV